MFDQICRTCLSSNGELISIFSKDYYIHNLPKKLFQTVQIKVLENDELPKMMCKKCIFLVDSLYCFKYQCEKAEIKLNKKLSHMKNMSYVVESADNFSETVPSSDEEYPVEYASEETRMEVENARKQKHKAKKKQNIPSIKSVEILRRSNRKLAEELNASDSDDRASVHVSDGSKIFISESILLEKNMSTYKTKEISEKRKSLEKSPSWKSKLKRKSENVTHSASKLIKKDILDDYSVKNENQIEQNVGDILKHENECSDSTIFINVIDNSTGKVIQNIKVDNAEIDPLHITNTVESEEDLKPVMKQLVINIPPICAICSESFESYVDVLKHKIIVHLSKGQRRFFCPICYEKFYTSSELIEHLDDHKNIYSFVCLLCSGNFYTKEKLRDHLTCHVNLAELTCLFCSSKFLDIPHLMNHLGTHINGKNLVCTLCTNMYDNKKLLQNHIDQDHMKLQENSEDEKNEIVEEIEDELENECSFCEQKFSSSKLLRNHMFTHLGGHQLPQYNCLVCAKTFATQGARAQHMKEHIKPSKSDDVKPLKNDDIKPSKSDDVKKFRCRVCHIILVSRASYTEHLKKEHWNSKQTMEVLNEITDRSINEQMNKSISSPS